MAIVIKQTFNTNQVAKMIGIHVNTVRLYESSGFITKPLRKENGYRVFTDLQISQLKIVRLGIDVIIMQNGIRKMAYEIIKLSGAKKFKEALYLTDQYITKIDFEISNALEAINNVNQLIAPDTGVNEPLMLRNEVSKKYEISMDTLRNWEMNGLLKTKRKENGYRVYSTGDIQKIKIIRSLRCANYSLSSILRMLNELSHSNNIDITKILDSPRKDGDIISACDKLISSLNEAKNNAFEIKKILSKLELQYPNPTL